MLSSHPNSSIPRPTPTREASALSAMSQREHGLFLAANLTGQASLGMIGFEPPAVQDAATLREVCREHRPEILLTNWSTPVLDESWLLSEECSIRYICHLTGSVRKIVPRRFIEKNGLVSNWGAHAAPMVAEHALLLALAALRNAGLWPGFIAQDPQSRRTESLATRTLRGRRVGLHGFGRIAQQLTELLRPFQVTISAYSAGVPADLMQRHGVAPADSLAALFASSEVVFECEALTEMTRGSVTKAVLANLSPGAVFVNVGRGKVVEESALVALAKEGRIRVAVDVISLEPATSESELARMPHVIVSPHIGGPTHDFYAQLGKLALENVERYRAGQSPVCLVSLEEYDRGT